MEEGIYAAIGIQSQFSKASTQDIASYSSTDGATIRFKFSFSFVTERIVCSLTFTAHVSYLKM